MDELDKYSTRIGEEELIALLEECRLKATDTFKESEYTLERTGIKFAPKGNIMALMAEAKAGKTWVNMQFAAAYVKGEFMNNRSLLGDKPKIMFFDTEQDPADAMKIQRRVQYVAGWQWDDDSHEEFRIYHLREKKFDQRMQLVSFAITHYQPDVVFIDGIRDLLLDFNDLKESAELVQELMRLSSANNCAIWTVLHVNPNSDKMRGHLGTEMQNKSVEVFKTTKLGEGDNIHFEVKHTIARHKDVPTWKFRINDDKPYGIPELVDELEAQDIELQRKHELFILLQRYMGKVEAWSQSKIKDTLKANEGYGSTKAWNVIQEAIRCKVLYLATSGKIQLYRLNPAFDPANRQNDDPIGKQEDEAPF